MQIPKLFALLPESCNTPDGMAVDSEGNLILSAANYADPSVPGCILKIDRNRNITKWVDVPLHPETGHAHPMGIAFGPDGDLYVVDNQGMVRRGGTAVQGTHPATSNPGQCRGDMYGCRERHGTPEWCARTAWIYLCHTEHAFKSFRHLRQTRQLRLPVQAG